MRWQRQATGTAIQWLFEPEWLKLFFLSFSVWSHGLKAYQSGAVKVTRKQTVENLEQTIQREKYLWVQKDKKK